MIYRYGEIKKKRASYHDVIRGLRRFLDKNENAVATRFLALWQKQRKAIDEEDVVRWMVDGAVPEEFVRQWQRGYDSFAWEEMLAIWNETAREAAHIGLKQLVLDADLPYKELQTWTGTHAAEFITHMTSQQRDTINEVIQRAMRDGMDIVATAKIIRPMIGLYPAQARAVLNHYRHVTDSLQRAYPKIKPDALQQRAQKASERYAQQQRRYRAHMVARTELCSAYNGGMQETVKTLVRAGELGVMMKAPLSAGDNRVCVVCKELNETFIPLESKYVVDGKEYDKPPFHPHCRCVEIFKEIIPPRR